ncbi:MAG: Fic family protein [Prevotellaceae bacterium]|jgi:cell filamentation protein|nr:Fic family protein [Prevotellaceae bacterium]
MIDSKISIRFFDDKEIRAVWDEENNKWWFSALDVVGVLNEQNDCENNCNCWKYLKARLKNGNNEQGSVTAQLKFTAPDGKKQLSDVLDNDAIINLAKQFPNSRATKFLDWWLTYSDNTVDGQSKKKAYNFWENNPVANKDVGTTKALQQIHACIFGGLYDFAGKIRDKTISKGGFTFCLAQYLNNALKMIDKMSETSFNEIVDKYVEMNVAHPFMEGNGRATRIWLDLIFKKRLKKCVDWSKINKNDYLNSMTKSAADSTNIRALLQNALTDKIHDIDIYMKGIEYSYYYEEESNA